MINKSIIFIFLCISHLGFGQFTSINFDFSNLGYGDNVGRPIILDDGILLEGQYINFAGKQGTHLTKLSFNGDILWQTRMDSLRTHVAPSSGGVIIRNGSIFHLLGPNDNTLSKGIRVLQFDFDGNLLEEYAWGDDLINEIPESLEKFGDGWALLLTANKPNGNDYSLVQLLDSNFVEKRRFTLFETTGLLQSHSLVVTPDNYFLTGAVTWHTGFDLTGRVAKFDSLGNLIWSTGLDTTVYDHDELTLIPVQDRIIVAWQNLTENIYPLSEESPEIVCLDSSGTVLWKHIFYSEEIHEQPELIPTSDGHFVGVSGVEKYPSLQYRGWMLKMTIEGEILWEREYWDEIDTIAPFLMLENGAEMSNGDWLLTGYIAKDSIGNGPFNFDGNTWLLWTNSEGCINPDCDTLQLLVSTESTNESIPEKEIHLSVLPNPVFESMVITQEGDFKPITGVMSFRIYSSLGQPIRDLGESSLPAHLTVTDLPQGIYFLQVMDKNRKAVQYLKFVKQ